MTFSRDHFSTLIKYIGISFITGAISHWAFSWTRSLLTGGFGVFCFIIGTLMEDNNLSTTKAIFFSALLAIAIGAVTWWLQHFPDSPERSLLIIPVGYIASLLLFAYIHKYFFSKKEYIYIAISSLITVMLTVWIFIVIDNTTIVWHEHNAEPIKTFPVTENSTGIIQDPESIPWHHH